MKTNFRPDNHIIGKVYDLTQENMCALISAFEENLEVIRAYETTLSQWEITWEEFTLMNAAKNKRVAKLEAMVTKLLKAECQMTKTKKQTVICKFQVVRLPNGTLVIELLQPKPKKKAAK